MLQCSFSAGCGGWYLGTLPKFSPGRYAVLPPADYTSHYQPLLFRFLATRGLQCHFPSDVRKIHLGGGKKLSRDRHQTEQDVPTPCTSAKMDEMDKPKTCSRYVPMNVHNEASSEAQRQRGLFVKRVYSFYVQHVCHRGGDRPRIQQ